MWTVIQATFSNANPLGTTPIGKLYSVNGRVGASEGKSKAEGDKEGKEQLRTIADTAAKVAVGPSVMRHHHGMYDDGEDDGGGYFVPDWYDPDADYDGADEAYVEARYEAAVDALMADAFGGVQWVAPEVAPGSWAEFNGLPDADDAGDIASGFGACGCQ